MKASLIRKPNVYELIPEYDIDIIAKITLEDEKFDRFITFPLEDYDFLEQYKKTSYKTDEVAHCIAIYPTTDKGYFLLVCTEGYSYARYAVTVPIIGGKDD